MSEGGHILVVKTDAQGRKKNIEAFGLRGGKGLWIQFKFY